MNWIDGVLRDVAELPDRNSPAEWPEAMLVTAQELRQILEAHWPAPSMPVNARLLDALIQCRDRFIFYVEHHLTNGAVVKAAENDRFVTLANQAIATAEAQQAGPVRPKVSFIPSVENMPMARSIDDEMMDLVDRLGALEPVDPRAWKHLLVYAPKTDPVRLTRVDIEKAFAQAGLKPEDYREDGEILPLVIAIESATLRKNGIEVVE